MVTIQKMQEREVIIEFFLVVRNPLECRTILSDRKASERNSIGQRGAMTLLILSNDTWKETHTPRGVRHSENAVDQFRAVSHRHYSITFIKISLQIISLKFLSAFS
ncbi:hypothetical protein CEXT_84191 [Caerostris extrusa]|uniref:Uncharacterized protein n=1 Tax=Caerostris extrusa TaxID=172846 RepID=A0AAV4YAT7_CAEEX|nr:hypothetical protein CEXT_84191 [Caerostris extrusa]